VEVHLHSEGHHAPRAEARVRQAEVMLGFLARCLDGT